MSADNWAQCPKCEVLEIKRTVALDETIKQAYGRVSSEKYLELLQKQQSPEPLGYTLREDYEIGIHGGEFVVSYGGRCNNCSFEYSFNHKLLMEV